MNDTLINLIREKINSYNGKIKEINKKLSEYKPVYDVLKPKGKPFKKENVINLTYNDELLNKLTDIVSNANLIAVEKLLKYKIEFERHDKEANKKLKEYGLSKQIIFSDRFLKSLKIRSEKNEKLKEVYNKLIEMKKRDEELFLINEEIVMSIMNVMIDLYENTLKEKEEVKRKKKILEYSLKDISLNVSLIPRNLSAITSLINDEDNEEKRKQLLEDLNIYLIRTKEDKKSSMDNDPKKELRKLVKYVDNTVTYDDLTTTQKEDEDDEDYICDNYLVALRSLNNTKDIYMFLDSIKYDCNIKEVLNKIINLLTTSLKDKELKEIITTYLYNITLDEKPKTDDTNKKIYIFYYGFLEKQNKILKDILKDNISNDYYGDILSGFKMIEKDGAKAKRENITKIKKVYKLRINDIRITFKQLTNNLYIILGVFCKKDSKGYNVINKTEKRNNELIKIEDSLIKSFDIKELFNEYVIENKNIELALEELLKSKRK